MCGWRPLFGVMTLSALPALNCVSKESLSRSKPLPRAMPSIISSNWWVQSKISYDFSFLRSPRRPCWIWTVMFTMILFISRMFCYDSLIYNDKPSQIIYPHLICLSKPLKRCYCYDLLVFAHAGLLHTGTFSALFSHLYYSLSLVHVPIPVLLNIIGRYPMANNWFRMLLLITERVIYNPWYYRANNENTNLRTILIGIKSTTLTWCSDTRYNSFQNE